LLLPLPLPLLAPLLFPSCCDCRLENEDWGLGLRENLLLRASMAARAAASLQGQTKAQANR
jgi:hypothetical protein